MDSVRKGFQRAATVAVFVAALGSCTTGLQKPAADSDIARAVNCFSAAWNRQDVDAFGKCFTSDADFVSVNGHLWEGRDAIQRNHAFLLGAVDVTARGVSLPVQTYGVLKGSTFAFTSITVRPLRSDVSVVRATWRMATDRASKARIGVMTLVVTRDAGVWRIAAVQDTETDRPAAS